MYCKECLEKEELKKNQYSVNEIKKDVDNSINIGSIKLATNNNDINNNQSMNNYINNNIDFNKINAKYQDDKKHIKTANIVTIIICILYILYMIYSYIRAQNSTGMFSGFDVLGVIVLGPIGFGIIIALYLLWRLCEYLIKNKINIGKKTTIIWFLVCVTIVLGINYIPKLFLYNRYNHEINSNIIAGTISSIEGEIVYIKENNKLTPYLVVDNYYGYENNTLLIRKNVLNNPIQYTENMDDEYGLYSHIKYSDSLIDKYLQSDEWINNFDKETLNIINNTKLYQNYFEEEEKYIRKFFIMSDAETNGFHTEAEWEYMATVTGMTEDWDAIKEDEIVYNDNGEKVNHWWLRIDNQNLFLYNTQSIYGTQTDKTSYIRPAFTIKSNTKIKKENDKWLLDIN